MSQEQTPDPTGTSWRATQAQAQRDLDAIQTDQDAYRFMSNWLSKDRMAQYIKLYKSYLDMNKTPRQAVELLLLRPPW